jgi:hypothetical protein
MRTTGRAIGRDPFFSQCSGTTSVPHSAAYLVLLPGAWKSHASHPLNSPTCAPSGTLEAGTTAALQAAISKAPKSMTTIQRNLVFMAFSSFVLNASALFASSAPFSASRQKKEPHKHVVPQRVNMWF